MKNRPELCFRRGAPTDRSAVEAFLAANERPTQGVAQHLAQFWLAVFGDQILGTAGRETYGEVALLRSVAVLPQQRKQGIARALIERVVHDARCENVRMLYLLTANASRYFESFGFRAIAKSDAPKALLASAEFQGACPATDILMGLSLASQEAASVDSGFCRTRGQEPEGLTPCA